MSHPYIPFANCASVEMIGTLAGQVVELTTAVRKGSAFSGSDLEDIFSIYDLWYHDTFRGLLTASISFDQIKVTDLTTASSPIYESVVSSPQAGALAVPVAPSNVAMVVKFTTDSRGRSYRGRNFVPGLPASDQESPGEFGTTPRADVANAYVDLAAALGVAGFDHVVLSRFNGGAARTTGVATRVTGYTCRAPIGTQRRRVPGVGI